MFVTLFINKKFMKPKKMKHNRNINKILKIVYDNPNDTIGKNIGFKKK